MGNVLFLGSGAADVLVSAVSVVAVNNADPAYLETAVNAQLLAASQGGLRLVDAAIAGSGQSSQFEVKLIFEATGVPPISANCKSFFYFGSNGPELQAAADAALARLVADANIDEVWGHGLAGGSQGRPFMGFFIGEETYVP